ncbi:MAG: hypothetical protein ABSH28_08115 [Acidobacteriota bacterium]
MGVHNLSREFEERLVHKLQQQVPATNVDDEPDARTHRREVAEVLLRSDTEIHTARLNGSIQLRDDLRERHLVGHEVVRDERRVRF